MADIFQEPKTFPEQVKLLMLVLSFEVILCGIVNTVGKMLAGDHPQALVPKIILLAAFCVTGLCLASNTASVMMSAAAVRGDADPEVKRLAKVAMPLVAAASLLLVAMFFFCGPTANLTAAGCGLAAMFLAMVFPVRRAPDKDDGKK